MQKLLFCILLVLKNGYVLGNAGTPDYYWCSEPLVYYSTLTASSSLPTREPDKALLDGDFAWTPSVNNMYQYLDLDFKDYYSFTSIKTQGKGDSNEFVTKFNILYSDDGESWRNVQDSNGISQAFEGNIDGNRKKENIFTTPIIARYLRILPLRWGERISMRVEVYGCQYERETVSFNKNSLMTLDYRRVPIASYEDNIRFRFKTVNPNAILLYSRGSQGDYFAVQLIENRMILNIDLGSRLMTSLSVGSLLDDNSWHDVEFVRREKNVSLIVDRVRVDSQILGDFKRLDLNKYMYIGGVPNMQPGLKARVNFTGCMENLFINGTPSFKKLKEGGGGFYYGEPEYEKHNLEFDCPFGPSSHLTVSFIKRGSYLRYPSTEADISVNVSLQFRTYEEDASLVYHKFSGNGYFLVFLEDGKIKVEIQAHGTPGKIILDNFDITFNDGRWHGVTFAVSKNKMELVVDNIPMKTSRIISISAGRYFYVGGMGKDVLDRPSFTGCMRYISTSGFPRRPKDEEIFPNKNWVVLAACQLLDLCNPNPCEHGGKCKQNSEGFACDCTGTGYSGSVCHTSLNPVSCSAFGNRNPGTKRAEVYIDVDGSGNLPPFPVTCEFFSDGRVLSSIGHKHSALTTVDGFEERGSYIQDIMYDASIQQIEVFLNRSAQCRQRLYFECIRTKLFNSPYLDPNSEFVPNSWWVSRQNQMMDYWGGSLPGSRKCECGLLGNCITKEHWCNCDSGLDAILHDTGDLTVKEHLPVKQMRVGGTGKVLDGRKAKYSVGSLVCEGDNIFDNVVTFRKADATIELPPFDMGISGDIYFEFKTASRDGCMIHAQGPTDYVKVCIVGGQKLQFQYEAGNGPQSVSVSTANILNDNQWHSVLVERNRKGGSLTVDQSSEAETIEKSAHIRAIHLTSNFIVGSTIDYRDGYVGCIRALILNGVLQDLRGRAEGEPLYGVGGGCIGKCSSNPCLNNGTCFEGYSSYECDCRWTAFKGPICADEIGIKMLTDTMVKYELPGTYKSTIAEDIRVGFTTTDPRGFLVALYSNITGEYLTLAVSNSGHLKVTFDFGFERYEQVYGKRTFHEGQNHNVILRRSESGRKLTMQVDNYEPMSWVYNVRASDDAQFNNIQYLYIGKNESMSEGFRGCISRVSFDDIYPLKMLFQQDRPKNIMMSPTSTTTLEDYCGIEPFRYPEEETETRPPLNISDSIRKELYPVDTTAILGGILIFLFLALLLMGCLIGRYVARHKGDYQTHEAEGADLAPDADWAVQHGRTGPQVKRNMEMYI
ncbi:UNVERIFIED_CONTAM: hypothetical protein RMT77_010353 [Armadillidium vulgare]